jgi:hypothetical protein
VERVNGREFMATFTTISIHNEKVSEAGVGGGDMLTKHIVFGSTVPVKKLPCSVSLSEFSLFQANPSPVFGLFNVEFSVYQNVT